MNILLLLRKIGNLVIFFPVRIFYRSLFAFLQLSEKTFLPLLLIIIAKKYSRNRQLKTKPSLYWGPTPLINNKYWSNALKQIGYNSLTYMTHQYPNFDYADYDKYLYEKIDSVSKRFPFLYNLFFRVYHYLAFMEVIKNWDILHLSFDGCFLSKIGLQNLEGKLIRAAGCKIIVMPYGGDSHRFSRFQNMLWKIGMSWSYPYSTKIQNQLEAVVNYWTEEADILLTGFEYQNGFSRNDVLIPSYLSIDINQWETKKRYNLANGKDKPVYIMHTPNHRGAKGTEFVIDSIEKLKSEGLQVELILLEGIKNTQVREIMRTKADILVEQLLFNGYALSGIEGMASGLPVVSNLNFPNLLDGYRIFSFLDECPIVSADPKNIYDVLKILITNPELRETLGKAGRNYVEKYHSYETSQYMFEKIYDKIWFGKEVDIMPMFHPLLSEYNKSKPKIEHPLINSQLPQLIEKKHP
jgi:glycosyltransferase involved in cell wall biosynthesis